MTARLEKLKARLEAAGIDPKVDRWSAGIEHHPEAYELVKDLAELDFEFFHDYFCWKVGGDGDNGETLCFMLDLLFELRDAEQGPEVRRQLETLQNRADRIHRAVEEQITLHDIQRANDRRSELWHAVYGAFFANQVQDHQKTGQGWGEGDELYDRFHEEAEAVADLAVEAQQRARS